MQCCWNFHISCFCFVAFRLYFFLCCCWFTAKWCLTCTAYSCQNNKSGSSSIELAKVFAVRWACLCSKFLLPPVTKELYPLLGCQRFLLLDTIKLAYKGQPLEFSKCSLYPGVCCIPSILNTKHIFLGLAFSSLYPLIHYIRVHYKQNPLSLLLLLFSHIVW